MYIHVHVAYVWVQLPGRPPCSSFTVKLGPISVSLGFLICPMGTCTADWLCIWNQDVGKNEVSGWLASFSRLLEAPAAFWLEPRWPAAPLHLQIFPSEVMESGVREADGLPWAHSREAGPEGLWDQGAAAGGSLWEGHGGLRASTHCSFPPSLGVRPA